MRIVNLTGQDVWLEQGTQKFFLPRGDKAVLSLSCEKQEDIAGVKVSLTKVLATIGLPSPKPKTVYLVNSDVFYNTDRKDVVSPLETSPAHGGAVVVKSIQKR